MSARLALPSRRNHITQKVRIGGRTLYLSVHDDQAPAEIFLREKGDDCTPKAIALYDVIARVMSIALQYGAPLKKVGDLLIGASGRRSLMISKLKCRVNVSHMQSCLLTKLSLLGDINSRECACLLRN